MLVKQGFCLLRNTLFVMQARGEKHCWSNGVPADNTPPDAGQASKQAYMTADNGIQARCLSASITSTDCNFEQIQGTRHFDTQNMSSAPS